MVFGSKLTLNPSLTTVAEHFLSRPNPCFTDVQLIQF